MTPNLYNIHTLPRVKWLYNVDWSLHNDQCKRLQTLIKNKIILGKAFSLQQNATGISCFNAGTVHQLN